MICIRFQLQSRVYFSKVENQVENGVGELANANEMIRNEEEESRRTVNESEWGVGPNCLKRNPCKKRYAEYAECEELEREVESDVKERDSETVEILRNEGYEESRFRATEGALPSPRSD